MNTAISHDRDEETIEAKARWFQTLSVEERMEFLCMYYELAITLNPRIMDFKDAQPLKGHIQVLSKT